MRGGKDERKQMDPLFPRLHIDDAEIGGPKPPPRNKMALCEQYNVASQRQNFDLGSMPTMHLPSGNGRSSFAPQASSSHVGSPRHKQKVLTTFCVSIGSSQLSERCNSYSSKGLNLNTPPTNSELRVLGRPANHQNPFVSENLVKTPQCNPSYPHGLCGCTNCCSKRAGNENGIRVPPSMVQNHGNLQDKERVVAFSSVPSRTLKLLDWMKQPKEISMDQSKDHSEKNSKLSSAEKLLVVSSIGDNVPSISLAGNKNDSDGLRSLIHQKNCVLADEGRKLHDPHAKPREECGDLQKSRANAYGMLERLKRKRCISEVQDLPNAFQQLGDKNEVKVEAAIKKWFEDKDCGLVQLGNAKENQETPQTSASDSATGLDLMPDDIVGVIGQRLFWKARKTILHQQRVFAMQIFELHRLIKVQKLIARSPEVLHDKNINLNIPSIKFPPINNNHLLYEMPLNPSSLSKKPKINPLKSDTSIDHKRAEAICGKLVPSLKSCDKEHPPHHSSPKSSSTPASVLSDPKIKPCCFHPPPGKQWLVPVRSPSEGLIYKPFTGPCPPSVSILAPIYGNYGPLNITPNNRMAFCVSGTNQHFPGSTLAQSYFQPFAIPLTGPNLDIESIIPHSRGSNKLTSTFDVNFSAPCQDSCNIPTKVSETVLPDLGRNLHRCRGSETQESSASSPTERSQRNALSLFPTTPSSIQGSKEQSNEQKVQVIKVVPHNPRSALESAARIFQSIQEERKRT